MKLVSMNYIGLSLISVSIIMFVILLTVSLDYAEVAHSICASPYCTTLNHIPVQSYAGFGILIFLAGMGSYLTFKQSKMGRIETISKVKLNKIVDNLQDDERKVFSELTKNDGSVFQNDLITTTGYSKVKISRLLDRLETKGLVERRRRGMSNIIVLK
ncbi:MAG: MarR family transcriptional regulator [Candidatus Aenigmarchaeota archaeon]|nr:MarR family transcriptional regulator [Candidatus Aenigmarchaeota archaeon]